LIDVRTSFSYTEGVPDEEKPQDKRIDCVDCGIEFVWTVAEQKLWKERKLEHDPKRCKACRDIRRQERDKQDQQHG